MIIYPLFRQSVRRNYKILGVFALLSAACIVLAGRLYEPEIYEKIKGVLMLFPEDFLSACRLTLPKRDLTELMADGLFGFWFLLLPVIYTGIVSVRLITEAIQKGTMVYYLAAPNARWRIVYTQAIFLAGSLGVLFLYTAGLGTLLCELRFPEVLSIGTFGMLCLGAYALQFALSGLSFLFACRESDRKHALLYGTGIPLLFFLFYLLSNMGGRWTAFRYVTLFTLFDMDRILSGDAVCYVFLGILIILGIVFYGIGITIFRKRDLSI